MRALAPAVYDNYYTRMLLGEQGIVVPVGALTRAHLAQPSPEPSSCSSPLPQPLPEP